MTLDALTLSEAPRVRLARREWAIPELAARQIMRLVPALGRVEALAREKSVGSDPLTEEEVRWIYDVAFIALNRGYPDLTREAFDDLPITIDEIAAATPTIATQAGLRRRDAGGDRAGEA